MVDTGWQQQITSILSADCRLTAMGVSWLEIYAKVSKEMGRLTFYRGTLLISTVL